MGQKLGKSTSRTVLLCGGEGCGKTALIRMIKRISEKNAEITDELLNSLKDIRPSQGLDIHAVPYQGLTLKFWDISGKASVS